MAPPSPPVRSPRARAPRAGRATLRVPAAGRRPARASLRDEVEAVSPVPDLPPLRLDLPSNVISCREVTLLPCLPALFGKQDEFIRRHHRRRFDPEDPQAAPELLGSALRAPAVQDRKCLWRVEVIVERRGELALFHVGTRLEDERVPKCLELCARLLHRLFAQVDRLGPV